MKIRYHNMSRSYFFTKALTLWNRCTERIYNIKLYLAQFYQYVQSYFYGHHDSWTFIDGHTLPLPQSHILHPVDATWTYSAHCLTSVSSPSEPHRLSWLSAKVVAIHPKEEQEIEIDSFLEKFRLCGPVPPLTMIFLCWCAEMRHWFRPDCIIQFHVITHEGEEEILSIRVDNNCLYLQDGKIYHRYVQTKYDYHVPNDYNYYHPC